jgi:hypothetical protein
MPNATSTKPTEVNNYIHGAWLPSSTTEYCGPNSMLLSY